jgi:hypothetical protein
MFPNDWYWVVAGDETQVYSSARDAYFPISDSAYITWKQAFCEPSRIPTEAEMLAILAAYGI